MRRKLKRVLRQIRNRVFGRPKAIITQVGSVAPDGALTGWCFNCRNNIPGLEIDDKVYYGGYSIDELRRIADEQ